jgi:hypothetical protein
MASIIASLYTRESIVQWVSADGKSSFLFYLKRNMDHYGGKPSNLMVTRPSGSDEVLEAILSLPSKLTGSTGLIVIDPLTRVLDMAKTSPDLWGRELFEDALPTLAAMVMRMPLSVLITSEMREGERGLRAVYYQKIHRWANTNLYLERRQGFNVSRIFLLDQDGQTACQMGSLEIDVNGWSKVDLTTSSLEVP